MDVETLASTAYSRVPGARLAGVVDIATGMFVALEAGNLPPEEVDLLAVSAREVLAGAPGAGLRRSFTRENDPQQLNEVIVVGEKTTFVICRAVHLEDAALVVACDKNEHLGLITMTMAKIRDNAGNA
jgi:predicted regulator of Ras-like GTPase activity (Roadblock/LC7/MglB family)